MPAIVDHSAFTQPGDADIRIWRYLDLAKLVSVLNDESLHFARIDQLTDQYEGSLSKKEYDYWRELAAHGEGTGELPETWRNRYFDVLMSNARRARRSMYVNCWHMGR